MPRCSPRLACSTGLTATWVPLSPSSERARELDPRSYLTLFTLAQAYSNLHRAQDAEGAASAALLVRSGDLNAIQWLAFTRVQQGNLASAREGIRAAIQQGVAAPRLRHTSRDTTRRAGSSRSGSGKMVFRLTPSRIRQ
jgi:hypothetical protein